MKIIFISNFHNHHQIPLCDAFLAIDGVDFKFIATEKVPEERIKFGYKHEFSNLPYYYEAIEPEDIATAKQWCFESDVVIIGSAPICFIKSRLKEKKLTFAYNERWFKDGFWNHPGDIWRAFRNYTLTRNENFYQLCASGFAASDMRRVFAFPNRMLRWGYFPEVKEYEDVVHIIKQKKSAHILWVGRLIDWKHPEAMIYVAKRLREEAYEFSLDMIGAGPLESELRKQITEERLGDYVHMLGSMSPEAVRAHMERAQIFLFTSDYREGWGAVLNEAMNSGCAVIASRAIGSVPYLIEHGVNGYVYPSEDWESLTMLTKQLLDEVNCAEQLGKSAYKTMIDIWNGEIAARRLYEFCSAKLSEDDIPMYESGPLSIDLGKAKKHGEFKRKKY